MKKRRKKDSEILNCNGKGRINTVRLMDSDSEKTMGKLKEKGSTRGKESAKKVFEMERKMQEKETNGCKKTQPSPFSVVPRKLEMGRAANGPGPYLYPLFQAS